MYCVHIGRTSLLLGRGWEDGIDFASDCRRVCVRTFFSYAPSVVASRCNGSAFEDLLRRLKQGNMRVIVWASCA